MAWSIPIFEKLKGEVERLERERDVAFPYGKAASRK